MQTGRFFSDVISSLCYSVSVLQHQRKFGIATQPSGSIIGRPPVVVSFLTRWLLLCYLLLNPDCNSNGKFRSKICYLIQLDIFIFQLALITFCNHTLHLFIDDTCDIVGIGVDNGTGRTISNSCGGYVYSLGPIAIRK